MTFSKECVIIILEGGDNIVAKDSLLEMLLEQYRQLDKEQQDEIEKLQAKDKEKDNIIQSLIKRIETLEKGVNK